MLIDKSPPKSFNTYTETKFHPRASKFQCETPDANSLINRNTTLNIRSQAAQSHTKPIDITKRTTRHLIALQREEIHLHPPEHRHKFPQPGNPDKLLIQPHPQGADTTIKRSHNLPACRKGTPISNLNKIKRQRNTQQVEEHGKNPPNQRGGDRESASKRIQNNDSKDYPKSWKQKELQINRL